MMRRRLKLAFDRWYKEHGVDPSAASPRWSRYSLPDVAQDRVADRMTGNMVSRGIRCTRSAWRKSPSWAKSYFLVVEHFLLSRPSQLSKSQLASKLQLYPALGEHVNGLDNPQKNSLGLSHVHTLEIFEEGLYL